MARRMGYRETLQWLLDNDDTTFLDVVGDPPYQEGNAHHDNYMAGFRDAHKQMDLMEQDEREAWRDA